MLKLGASIPALGRSLAQAIDRARIAEALGYESIWVTQLPDARDQAMVLSAYACSTDRIGLGTAVLPIHGRHPTAMAQMAATLDEISAGRFSLGVGVGHQVTVEVMLGLSWARPLSAMREYLTILRDCMSEGIAHHEGGHFTARWSYAAPRRPELPLLVGALGPRMLELAGELADGVVLWMCSPQYVRSHVLPRVTAGRRRAGRTMEGFDVVASVPIGLTTRPEAGWDAFRKLVTTYFRTPAYRQVFAASGFTAELASGRITDTMLADLGAFGDSATLREFVARYLDAGCTLPVITPVWGYPGDAGVEATLGAALS